MERLENLRKTSQQRYVCTQAISLLLFADLEPTMDINIFRLKYYITNVCLITQIKLRFPSAVCPDSYNICSDLQRRSNDQLKLSIFRTNELVMDYNASNMDNTAKSLYSLTHECLHTFLGRQHRRYIQSFLFLYYYDKEKCNYVTVKLIFVLRDIKHDEFIFLDIVLWTSHYFEVQNWDTFAQLPLRSTDF